MRFTGLLLAASAMILTTGFAPAPMADTTLNLTVEGKGEIVIRLATDKAPRTTAHIMRLAESGFYNGQKFFRVVTEPRPFLVQFGDPGSRSKPMGDPDLGKGGSGAKIAFEDTGLPNVEGSVGLSTPQGQRDAGDSQFYVNLDNNRFLDGNYTVFGQVVRGMDVVKRLRLGDQVTSATVKRG